MEVGAEEQEDETGKGRVQGDGEEEREAEKVVTQVQLERNPRPNSLGLSKVFVPQQLASICGEDPKKTCAGR